MAVVKDIMHNAIQISHMRDIISWMEENKVLGSVRLNAKLVNLHIVLNEQDGRHNMVILHKRGKAGFFTFDEIPSLEELHDIVRQFIPYFC